MKQFILIAYDATDEKAPDRRLAVREEHLAQIARLRSQGHMLFGAAITDDDGKMIGSVISAQFASREEFDGWLKTEPYVLHKVWDKITVLNAKLAPTFSDLLTKAS